MSSRTFSGPRSDSIGKVIRLKITQGKKNVVVVLADFQVLLVAVEKGIDRNKSRLCYFQMHCSWFREEYDEPCLWLGQVPLLFGCSAGSQVGTALPGWKAELEVEKASGFGRAREQAKTQAIAIRV